tara:strand:+ start:58 stop:372 length:315 start_codon:yes stop_codon:yes gene_type:complete
MDFDLGDEWYLDCNEKFGSSLMEEERRVWYGGKEQGHHLFLRPTSQKSIEVLNVGDNQIRLTGDRSLVLERYAPFTVESKTGQERLFAEFSENVPDEIMEAMSY